MSELTVLVMKYVLALQKTINLDTFPNIYFYVPTSRCSGVQKLD